MKYYNIIVYSKNGSNVSILANFMSFQDAIADQVKTGFLTIGGPNSFISIPNKNIQAVIANAVDVNTQVQPEPQVEFDPNSFYTSYENKQSEE